MKKPLHERIESARARKAQLAARLAALESRAKAVDRKRDTRRKIIVGAAVLIEMERVPKFAAYVREMLDLAVPRPQDREVIGHLLQGAPPLVTPAVNGNAAPALEPAGHAPEGASLDDGVFPALTREEATG